MEYNIVIKYTRLIKSRFEEFFKIVLKNKYQKNLVDLFIDRYIEVRYLDETNYDKEKDFIERLNKELVDVYNENENKDNEDLLKTIVALFGYLTYLDDLAEVRENLKIIDALSKDVELRIELTNDLYSEIKEWYYTFKSDKSRFYDQVSSKEFSIIKTSVFRKTYEVDIEHNVKITNLYSDYAINKAFNSGVVNEDKLFINYVLTSFEILNNAINLDYSSRYIVPLANTLYDKEKKIERLFNVINNELTKKMISIKINYTDYKQHKQFINNKIKEGYSFAVVLDTDDIDKNELILFSYVYVFENSKMFDIIDKDSKNIEAKIIKI